MKPKISNGVIQKGSALIGAAMLALGLTVTGLRADGPPAPPPITYQVLNFWFFRATNNFATVRGDAPLTATNLMATTNAWGRGAVHVVTNKAMLKYRETATNATRAWTNLLVDEGCLRFWFRNHWQSSSLGGTGPGTYARLIEVGDSSSTNGYWTLYFHPAGTNLYFASTTNGAVGGLYLSAPIQWASNYWHLVTLNYSRSNCQLFIDGAMVCTNTGLARWPGPSVRTNGFTLGGDCRATNLFKGDISDLVACRGYFTPESVTNTYENMASYYPLGPDGGQSLLWQGEEENAMLLSGMGGELESQGFYVSTNQGLTLLLLHQETNVVLAVTNGEAGVFYDLYRSTSLSGTSLVSSPWLALARLTNGEPYTDTNDALAFYILGDSTNDLDGDTLTDAFEALVSKTDRSNPDSDADGLSDYYEVCVSGTSPILADSFGDGIPDGYRDFDGDGWNNIQEFQNGTAPWEYNSPAPLGLEVDYVWGSSDATLRWNPAPGAVTSYVIRRYIPELWLETFFTNSASTLTFTDTAFPEIVMNYWLYGEPTYQVLACYSSSNAPWGAPISISEPNSTAAASIFRGPQGKSYLLIYAMPSNTVTLRLTRLDWEVTSYEAPATSATNGIFAIPDAWLPAFGGWRPDYYLQLIDSYGQISKMTAVGKSVAIPFFDGREQLLQNLAFQIRASSVMHTFGFKFDNYSNIYYYTNLASYACADYFSRPWEYGWHEYRPFFLNHIYRNFTYAHTNLSAPSGGLLTGAYSAIQDVNFADLFAPTKYTFSAPTSADPIPSVLTPNESRWVFSRTFGDNDYVPTSVGVFKHSDFPSLWRMTNNARNLFGLTYLSVQWAWNSNGVLREMLLTPGTNLYRGDLGKYYPEAEQPVFQPAGYYFCRSGIGPRPGDAAFSPDQPSPFLFSGVGQQIQVAGYAKLSIQNGYTNKLAFLGQYFDQAYRVGTNSLATSTPTGLVSPYGEYVATEPGYNAIVTMPSWTGAPQGTATVFSVKMQLDVNHDGLMDSTFTGPDNTSQYRPFKFWLNNDLDRIHTVDAADAEEDDLREIDNSVWASQKGNQYLTDITDENFQSYGSSWQPAIPCRRDLEDYARLWLSGLNVALSALPTNYTVRLTLSGDARIRLFRAVEAGGGTNYLFDTVTASNQVAQSASLYLGLLTAASPVTLSGQTNLGEHFIFCGAQRGSAEIHFQVLDGSQNLIADTAAWIELKDIKEMYERWTVGDAGSMAPMPLATNAVEGLPVGAPAFRYGAAPDTNTPYILHVHGWNMQTWEKDRFAETAYKRLYWQGYQGRFGSFRWPTRSGFDTVSWQNPLSTPNHFDRSEFNAWQSGVGLRHLLTRLNNAHPGHVYLTAHSMGNIVAGEALRLAGTNQLVNTYVAMQAAVAAHAYDPNATPRTIPVLADDGTPNRFAEYYTNGAPAYFANSAGAGNFINFYNPQDYAFAATRWQLDQDLKPAGTINYAWDGYEFSWGHGEDRQVLNFPEDTYQIFAFCDEARCYALGAQANVGGRFSYSEEIDLDDSYDFGSAHKGHSAQFRSTNMRRSLFWNDMLEKMRLKQ